MATTIQKVSKGVYQVDDLEIKLTGRVIPTGGKDFITTSQIIALRSFLKAEDENLRIKSTIR